MLKFSLYPLILVTLISCQGIAPSHLGPQGSEGKTFFPCSSTSNCISTTEDPSQENYIEPIPYTEPKEMAYSKMVRVIESRQGCVIKTKKENYIWAECTSAIFKFVDDLEIIFNMKNEIHMKSASRKGKLDFGVNKKRLNEIIFNFHQSGNR